MTATTTTSGNGDHQIWGTLEELLLACAVSRHGTRSWDSVAVELQSRIPSSAVTPVACRQRYLALHRRFSSNSDDDAPPPPPDPAWLDNLRRLRVAELRREVERSDVSIVSLQSKVRRLREERERSLTVGGGDSDLKPADRISGGSCKESNSAVDPAAAAKADPAAAVGGEEKGGGGGEGSCNGSSEAAGAGRRSGESASEEGEGEREKESSDVQSSASLSKGRRRRRKSGGSSGGEGGKGDVESQPLVRVMEMIRSKEYGTVFERRLESQGSARYRSLIRRHMDLELLRAKLGRGAYESTAEFFRDLLLLCTNAIVFYPRDSPESSAAVRLRSLVSREMSCHEHEWKPPSPPPPPPTAAQPAAKEPTPPPSVPAPKPKPGPDSKMPAPKPKLESEIKMPVPLIACKKRSFISAKPSATPPPLPVSAKEEKKPDIVRKEQQEEGEENHIPVLAPKKTGGTRGLRTNKSRARSGAAIAKAPNLAPPTAPIPIPVPAEVTQPPQSSKAQKKSGTGSGATAGTGMSMAKKRGAATFLSRLNERSPTSPPSGESLKGSSSEQKKGDGKKVQVSRPRPTKAEQAAPGKRSVGRPPKRSAPTPAPTPTPTPAKKAKEEAAPAKPPPASRKKGRKC